MNSRLIRNALRTCPVIEYGWKLVVMPRTVSTDGLFVWKLARCTNRACGYAQAVNAMTAVWLEWLIEKKADPFMYVVHGNRVCEYMDRKSLERKSVAQSTLLEVLAAAVCAVGKQKS